MFIIASTGRCGTQAICHALDQYSDHEVRHEPEPLLLAEAWRAHRHRWWVSPTYLRRMAGFRRADGSLYGESVRCAPLLGHIARIAPTSRVVVLFRSPSDYLTSAWGRGVMRKNDQWDRWRILPRGSVDRGPVDKILFHYAETNNLLATAVERHRERAMAVEVHDLDQVIVNIAEFVGAVMTNRDALSAFLSGRPNAGPIGDWASESMPPASNDAVEQAHSAYRRLLALMP